MIDSSRYQYNLSRYLRIVAFKQDKVRETGTNSFTFRCPYCGDSAKDPRKTRGYLYLKKNTWFFKCHNCGIAKNGQNFFKDQEPELFKKYRMELMQQHSTPTDWEEPEYMRKPVSRSIEDPLKSLTRLDQLEKDHAARVYLISRKLDPSHFDRIYYTPKFMAFVNTLIPEKFTTDALEFDGPRIIFPFTDSSGKVFGFTGRSIEPHVKSRYVSIILNDAHNKVYGLDRVDMTKDFFVCEGPIDSLFLSNAIAMAGSDIEEGFLNREHAILVFDNEPRNKEIVNRIEKYIMRGFRVCIWPSEIEEKDINDMILAGRTPMQVEDMIRKNAFDKLKATLKLLKWRKT